MHRETVQQFMSLAPKTIEASQTVEQASEYMRKLHTRHLPVSKNGKLIGIVTERDLGLILAFRDLKALVAPIESVLTPDPLFVGPETSIHELVGPLGTGRYQSVLVMDRGRVIGVLTAVDILRAISETMNRLKYA